MATLSRKARNELLVYGYIRTEKQTYSLDIPEDIAQLFFLWYHIDSFFMKAGDHCTINEERNMVEFDKSPNDLIGNSCYGSIEMQSKSEKDIEYEYQFKIIKCENVIGIGIDDTRCKWLNDNFTLPRGYPITKHYAYISSSGHLYSWQIRDGKDYGHKYHVGDTVKMIYNPCKSTLQFVKNNEKQDVIKDIYSEQGLSYRICIYMGYEGNQIVELIE